MYEFCALNKLISPNQSDFTKGDLLIDQLLSITHKTSKSFDNHVEIWGKDLDISKVYDKVWKKGLFPKLTQNDVSGNVSKCIIDTSGTLLLLILLVTFK